MGKCMKNQTFVLSIPYFDRINNSAGSWEAVVRASSGQQAWDTVNDLLGEGEGIQQVLKLLIKDGIIDELPGLEGVTDEEELLAAYDLEIGDYSLFRPATLPSLKTARHGRRPSRFVLTIPFTDHWVCSTYHSWEIAISASSPEEARSLVAERFGDKRQVIDQLVRCGAIGEMPENAELEDEDEYESEYLLTLGEPKLWHARDLPALDEAVRAAA